MEKIKLLRNTTLLPTHASAKTNLNLQMDNLSDGEVAIATYGDNWENAQTLLGLVRKKDGKTVKTIFKPIETADSIDITAIEGLEATNVQQALEELKTTTKYDDEYVDLGLPSGTLWCKHNLGAIHDYEVGDYYMWGDTQHCNDIPTSWQRTPFNGGYETFNSGYFNSVKNDVLINNQLKNEYDAVYLQTNGYASMPTAQQFQELYLNTHVTYTMDYNNTGVGGVIFTNKTNENNYIFIPKNGRKEGLNIANPERCEIWCKDLSPDGDMFAIRFEVNNTTSSIWNKFYRYCGLSLRGVTNSSSQDRIKANAIEYTNDNIKGCYNVGSALDVLLQYNSIINDTIKDEIGGYEYVDLGLPSGLLWATCNVGALKPCDPGLLFQFGRVEGYNYGTREGSSWEAKDGLIKTSEVPPTESGRIYNIGETLDLADDAARYNMGGAWRMPTESEARELYANTTNAWTTCTVEHEGEHTTFSGRLYTSNINGKTLFIPAGGYWDGAPGNYKQTNGFGTIWTSTIKDNDINIAYDIDFSATGSSVWNGRSRANGSSIRPVCDKGSNIKKISPYSIKYENAKLNVTSIGEALDKLVSMINPS